MNRAELLVLLASAVTATAAAVILVPSNVDPDHKYSWNENAGWMNWRDANAADDGVFVAADHLSGFIWMENAGWLNVGDGSAPYANNDDTDFGVNILGSGDLDGMAWGENIGWVNFGWAAATANPDRARFDSGAGRFRGYAWSENTGWINLDDADHFVATAPAVITPEPCPNDFELAANGAGGDRLSRFICIAAPEPPAAAGGPTALRVVLRTMYNTTPGDPDGANVCPSIGRTKPDLTQFEGQTRWVGAPAAAIDDAVPQPPDYLVAPLVCTAAKAELRNWSPAALAADFPSATSDRIFFYGSEVVPCSVYEVSQCADPLDESTCAAPVLIFTGKLGDCWPPFDPAQGQPSFIDIGATVAKFKSFPFTPGATPTGGPPEWHALLRGNVVADYDISIIKKVDFIDIGQTVNSFKSIAYNQDGPCNPGTGMDNCGNPCNTAP